MDECIYFDLSFGFMSVSIWRVYGVFFITYTTSGNYRVLEKKFELNLPKYSGIDQIVELPPQN